MISVVGRDCRLHGTVADVGAVLEASTGSWSGLGERGTTRKEGCATGSWVSRGSLVQLGSWLPRRGVMQAVQQRKAMLGRATCTWYLRGKGWCDLAVHGLLVHWARRILGRKLGLGPNRTTIIIFKKDKNKNTIKLQ